MRAFGTADLAAVLATCHRQRRRAGHRLAVTRTNQEGETNDVRFVKDGVRARSGRYTPLMNPEPVTAQRTRAGPGW